MADTEHSLIRLRDLHKIYYTDELETHALIDVDLDIERGDFISVAGPSGCGKSTLLGIIGLLDHASGGEYELDGNAVQSLAAAERARIRNESIGFIFQAFNLIGDLTVYENVELPLVYRGTPGAPRRERVEQAVARAIVGDPLILLADEPTGNLDSANGRAVMELLGELHVGGATVCMVTHDPRYASIAARTVHLLDGRIVDEVEAVSATDSSGA